MENGNNDNNVIANHFQNVPLEMSWTIEQVKAKAIIEKKPIVSNQ